MVFDATHHFLNRPRSDQDECYRVRRVVYSDLTPIPDFSSVTGDRLLVTKGKVWEYEREWRMLAPLEDAEVSEGIGEEAIHLFTLPPGSVSGVVLGARVPTRTESIVLGLLKEADWDHVRLGRISFGRSSSPSLAWVSGSASTLKCNTS